MKKLVSILMLAFLSANTFAQKSIIFKYAYKPNKTYKTTSNVSANIKMSMLDSLGKPDTTKVKGGTMDMDNVMDFELAMKTGTPKADKKIPFRLVYNKMTAIMEMAGKKQNMPMPDIEKMSITGVINNGNQLAIDSISGIADEQKEMFKKMIYNLQQGIKFPNQPIKVGDTFTVAMPFDIPMKLAKMEADIKMIYKLVSIKDGKGFFDYTATMDMNAQAKSKSLMKMNGDGKGNLVYDLSKEFVTQQNGTMHMKMDMALKPMQMKMDMAITTGMKTLVE